MSKFKFINIIDLIFITMATFLIVFAWLQFFLKNILISILLSAIVSSAILFVIKFFKNRKYTSAQNKLNQDTNIVKFKLALQTLSSTKFSQYIKKIIPKNFNPTTQKGDIIFKDDSSTTLCTYVGELNESKLLEVIKTKSAGKLIIFCTDYSKDVKTLSTAFEDKSIKLIKLEELYEIFNKHNITINTDNINLSQSKITFKEIILGAISRDKSKGYFISGLILLFTSLIIPYKIYYVIFSTVLIGLSIACRLRPKTKLNKDIFN